MNPENIFLTATDDEESIAGVLGIKVQGLNATLRRWEPAVPLDKRENAVGELLIKHGIQLLSEGGVQKIPSNLRFPYYSPETSRWYINLLKKCMFQKSRPDALMFLNDLSQERELQQQTLSIKILGRDSFSLEDFADFTKRAFASTAVDKDVHEWDPCVSNYDHTLRMKKIIRDGRLGYSPSEFWKVAVINGKPIGYLISFIP
ncbi:MAG: hypothetical protein GF308_15880 [Candidatus Heimdallarchaeota archaeon]|nr:hypothetical protein [Candidatus Heimdallarchaeota archaeon]